jgi:hypothetical protein
LALAFFVEKSLAAAAIVRIAIRAQSAGPSLSS